MISLRATPVALASLTLFCSALVQAGSLQRSNCSPLLLVGGGARPEAALRAWVEESQVEPSEGSLVVAWASGEPQESFETIRAELLLAGAPRNIAPSLRAPRSEKDASAFLEELAQARLIWFTGGDQNRIADALEQFPSLTAELRRRYAEGTLAVGGTSAGTAIQSAKMFTGNEDLARIDPTAIALRSGLGLLPPHLLVDQHFLRRQRQNRLISALLSGAARIGLGIDEDNAVLVRECRRGTPFGSSPLSVYRVQTAIPGRIVLDFVHAGTEIDLGLPQSQRADH
jgi:cyanophycinase